LVQKVQKLEEEGGEGGVDTGWHGRMFVIYHALTRGIAA
jgi:hypothetical protein